MASNDADECVMSLKTHDCIEDRDKGVTVTVINVHVTFTSRSRHGQSVFQFEMIPFVYYLQEYIFNACYFTWYVCKLSFLMSITMTQPPTLCITCRRPTQSQNLQPRSKSDEIFCIWLFFAGLFHSARWRTTIRNLKMLISVRSFHRGHFLV